MSPSTHLPKTLVSMVIFSTVTLKEAGTIGAAKGVFWTIRSYGFPINVNKGHTLQNKYF